MSGQWDAAMLFPSVAGAWTIAVAPVPQSVISSAVVATAAVAAAVAAAAAALSVCTQTHCDTRIFIQSVSVCSEVALTELRRGPFRNSCAPPPRSTLSMARTTVCGVFQGSLHTSVRSTTARGLHRSAAANRHPFVISFLGIPVACRCTVNASLAWHWLIGWLAGLRTG